MVVKHEEPLRQFVLNNISWDTYEKLLEEIGPTHYRLTYDEGDLEIMTLSFYHDNVGRWIGRLIFFVALELQLSICSGGSTTLKHSLRKKGLEPDECFWIKHEANMRGKKSWNVLTDPPPDLAVEVEISSSALNRLGIYAALKVPEIWRYDGDTFRVMILAPNGKYKEKGKSLAFPTLPIEDFSRFVGRLGSEEEVKLAQDFIAWLRTEIVPKKNGRAGRKNGRR